MEYKVYPWNMKSASDLLHPSKYIYSKPASDDVLPEISDFANV